MAAGERGHEPGGIVMPAQRQRGQRQPGRPALGPGRQRRHRRIGQGRPRVLEQLRRLRGREPQLSRAHFGQLAACPQPRQRQRRVAAAGQHHAYPGRPVLKQERERLVHLPRADQVVIVEDQQGLVRSQFVDQGRDQALERRRRRRPEQRAYPLADPLALPPARPQNAARTGPGRCPPRPATATRPGTRRAGPTRSAGPSCRTRRGRRPGPAPAPGPHPGAPSAAAAAPGPAATRACAAWWPARHPAPGPSPTIQPSLTCTLTASSDPYVRCWKDHRNDNCRASAGPHGAGHHANSQPSARRRQEHMPPRSARRAASMQISSPAPAGHSPERDDVLCLGWPGAGSVAARKARPGSGGSASRLGG